MILKFNLFENVQQSEKILKDHMNPKLDNFYNELLNIIEGEDKKYMGYLSIFLTYYLFLDDKNVLKVLKKIINERLNINLNDKKFNPTEILKWRRLSDLEKKGEVEKRYNNLKVEVDTLKKNRLTQNFIEQYVPGFLKSEIKKKKNFNILSNLKPWELSEEKLKGSVSLFDNAKEYIEYIKNIRKEKLDRKNIDIISETDEYIIYSPKTYEAMNSVIFSNWCLIDRKQYNKYLNLNYKTYIMYNLKDIKDSYILMVNQDDFNISDYYNNIVIQDENYSDKIFEINKNIDIFLEEIKNIDTNLRNLIE